MSHKFSFATEEELKKYSGMSIEQIEQLVTLRRQQVRATLATHGIPLDYITWRAIANIAARNAPYYTTIAAFFALIAHWWEYGKEAATIETVNKALGVNLSQGAELINMPVTGNKPN